MCYYGANYRRERRALRKLVLVRLDGLVKIHKGFKGSCSRWRDCFWHDTHVKDVAYRGLSDIDLLTFFEFIIYRHFKQM